MRAVITGATSGIGLKMAEILHNKGYSLTLIARREDRLKHLKEVFGEKTQIIKADLSEREEVMRAFSETEKADAEILINNAGFGLCGEFEKNSLERELEMIDTNVCAVHILTKLFLEVFEKNKKGYILNVSSIAAFSPGPLLAAYYSTKTYVRVLTESIYGELKSKKSPVYIGILCPGPVRTEFDHVANVKFSLKGADPGYVAEYAIKKMFAKKLVILPTFSVKAAAFLTRFMPEKLLIKIAFKMQRRKIYRSSANRR